MAMAAATYRELQIHLDQIEYEMGRLRGSNDPDASLKLETLRQKKYHLQNEYTRHRDTNMAYTTYTKANGISYDDIRREYYDRAELNEPPREPARKKPTERKPKPKLPKALLLLET